MILHTLNRILLTLETLSLQRREIMALLDALAAQVAQNTSVEQSAITLIEGLAAQLASAGTDPAKLADLQQQLNTSATALSAAITANTPAAPAPAVPATPTP